MRNPVVVVLCLCVFCYRKGIRAVFIKGFAVHFKDIRVPIFYISSLWLERLTRDEVWLAEIKPIMTIHSQR